MAANDLSFLYPNGTFMTDQGSFLTTTPITPTSAGVHAAPKTVAADPVEPVIPLTSVDSRSRKTSRD